MILSKTLVRIGGFGCIWVWCFALSMELIEVGEVVALTNWVMENDLKPQPFFISFGCQFTYISLQLVILYLCYSWFWSKVFRLMKFCMYLSLILLPVEETWIQHRHILFHPEGLKFTSLSTKSVCGKKVSRTMEACIRLALSLSRQTKNQTAWYFNISR